MLKISHQDFKLHHAAQIKIVNIWLVKMKLFKMFLLNKLDCKEQFWAENNCVCPAAAAIERECMYLVFLSTALLIVFEYVVSHVVLWIDQQLLGLSLFIPSLHPHHKHQHQHCRKTESEIKINIKRAKWLEIRQLKVQCVIFSTSNRNRRFAKNSHPQLLLFSQTSYIFVSSFLKISSLGSKNWILLLFCDIIHVKVFHLLFFFRLIGK